MYFESRFLEYLRVDEVLVITVWNTRIIIVVWMCILEALALALRHYMCNVIRAHIRIVRFAAQNNNSYVLYLFL